MANLDYWYDQQISRYLLQLIRIFSGFKVKEMTTSGPNFNRVPVKYNDSSRQVAHILRNNSENIINSLPMITVGIQSIQLSRPRTQEPYLQDTTQVAERRWDSDVNQYTSEQGNLYTTQRYMPVPYDMSIQVDVWSPNTDTKLQILEQIFVIFNPSLQLQSNDNPLDWSNVFEVELTDINWTNRSVPQGTDDPIDIATLTFQVPIWISPPAKVKRQTIIQKIIADIHSTSSIEDLGYSPDYADFFGPITDDAEIIVTPNNYRVQVVGATATLVDMQGVGQDWSDIIEMLGSLSLTSVLKLNISNDSDNELNMVVGSVTAHPTESDQLVFNLDTDTLPADTLADVDQIIDARASSPGSGLPAATLGDRYLLTEDIDAVGHPAWGVDASENDIIQYNGTAWTVVFDASAATSNEYVTNAFTSTQYKFDFATGVGLWISSYEGEYKEGFWTLVL